MLRNDFVQWSDQVTPECIFLTAMRNFYVPLADFGVSLRAPLLVNCVSEQDCLKLIDCLRGDGIPDIVQLNDSPKVIENALKSAEYGAVFILYSMGRNSTDNLLLLVQECQEAFFNKKNQLLVVIFSYEEISMQHRLMFGLCVDVEDTQEAVPLDEECTHELIRGFVRGQNIIQNRIWELAEAEETETIMFRAVRISTEIVLQDAGVDSAQLQELMAPLDQWIEDFHETNGFPTDPNEVAELFGAEFVGYLCELPQPALLECRQIESTEINRLDNTVGFDNDFYYLPIEIFDTVAERMHIGSSKNEIKKQLNAAGLLIKEGQGREYYTVKVKYVNVFGVPMIKRRVRLNRNILDNIGGSSLVAVFGKSEKKINDREEIQQTRDYECLFSKQATNPSILITGESGSGKTYGMNRLEKIITNTGGTVLVFNYNGTHLPMLSSQFVRIVNPDKLIPIPLLTPIVRPDGSEESEDEVVDFILDMFENVSKLGVRQRPILQEALVAEIRDHRNASLQGVAKRLKEKGDEVSMAVLNRYEQIFSKAVFQGTDWDWLEKGKILVLDFTGYNPSAQKLLTEFCASALWRYHRVWGQYMEQPLYLAFDEFQVLNLGKNAVLSQILREGRKFHLALILATQTLESFSPGQRAIILQAATCLYFRPAPSEVRKVARYTGADELKSMEKELRNLKRGECIATGQFDGIDSPIKLHF